MITTYIKGFLSSGLTETLKHGRDNDRRMTIMSEFKQQVRQSGRQAHKIR